MKQINFPGIFHGEKQGTYIPERDRVRLSKGQQAVYDVMSDGDWHTLQEICERTGYPTQTVGARLRDLRYPHNGGFIVHREYINHGIHQYRIEEPEYDNSYDYS